MKIILTIIGAVAIAAAIYLSRAPNQPPVDTEMLPVAASPAVAVEAPQKARLPRTPAAPSFWKRPPPSGDFDPMLVMAMGDFSDEEIARYNDLHILPFNKAVGQECEEIPHPNFTDRSYTACKTIREFPDHPYTDLDSKALLELAVHDEVAALMLGRRVKQEEERMSWYLRAAALSGKSGPLMSLAENRYGVVHKLKTVDGKFQAVAQPGSIAVRIALDTVAQKMGDPRANPERWRQRLREVAAADQADYLARANKLVEEFLVAMALTQREITGSIQIQEIIDNA